MMQICHIVGLAGLVLLDICANLSQRGPLGRKRQEPLSSQEARTKSQSESSPQMPFVTWAAKKATVSPSLKPKRLLAAAKPLCDKVDPVIFVHFWGDAHLAYA